MRTAWRATDALRHEAKKNQDSVATSVWARAREHMHKLALLYACSENHQEPRISLAAVEWAQKFVMHQTKRMLFMAASHVADNPFEGECLKMTELLRRAPGKQMPHSVLLKNMHCGARIFAEIVDTLTQRGDVMAIDVTHPGIQGRTGRAYLLVE